MDKTEELETEKERIGLFGGTFNPIHYGHLAMVGAARSALGLDGVWLVPAGQPPHRDDPDLAPAQKRLAWCRRVAAGIPGLDVWDGEIRRSTPAYTWDTLTRLRGQLPEAELFWIVGWDAFVQLPTWHRWEELLGLAHFVVVGRGGETMQAPAWLEGVGRWTPANSVVGRSGAVFPVSMHRVDISATGIRQAVREGRSLIGRLPAEIMVEVQATFVGRL